MSTDPEMSVLVTAYGRTRYLADAVRSVLAQQADPDSFEVVVVTDQEGTYSEALPPTGQGPSVRVHVSRQSKKGPFFADGIRQCRGRSVSFLNDDDVWLPGKLAAVQASLLAKPEVGLHRHAIRYFRDDPARIVHPFGERKLVGPGAAHPRTLSRQEMQWPRSIGTYNLGFNDSAMSLRRSILDRSLPFLERVTASEDTFLLFAALALSESVVSDPRALALYRIHSTNSSVAGRSRLDAETLASVHREFLARLETYTVIREMVQKLAPDRSDTLRFAERGVSVSRLLVELTDIRAAPARVLHEAAIAARSWNEFDPWLNGGVVALAALHAIAPTWALRTLLKYGKVA